MIGELKPYSAYKDSGIPWLGEIPKQWNTERAKWLFQKMDRPVRASDEVVTCFRDGTVTLRKNRRVQGFTESIKEIGYQGIRKGDLVIHGMDAFAGAIGVSDSEGKSTPVYSVCQPREGVDARFYSYVVREMARNQWILALAKGIRERSTDFRFSMFASLVVPFPPLEEQAAIAHFLNYADRRIRRCIRTKQKLVKLLEEQKQVVINEAVTRGLNPDVSLKPSGIEWLKSIPEHWEISRLKFETSQIVDCLHATPEYSEDGKYPAIRTADIEPGKIRLENAKCVHREQYELWTFRMIPKHGDILYSREGERFGIAAPVPESTQLCISQRMMAFRIRTSQNSRFMMWQLNCRHVYSQAAGDIIGAAAPHVNVEKIKNYQIVLPPLDEQERIVAAIEENKCRLDSASAQASREIDLLREFRTRLIADIVTGKLDVRAAAAKLPTDETDFEPSEADLAEDDIVTADDLDFDEPLEDEVA